MYIYFCLFESDFVCKYFKQVLIGCFLIPAKCILIITLVPRGGYKEAGAFNPFRKKYCHGRGQTRVMPSPGSLRGRLRRPCP